jgi:hypothetical protein
VDFVRRINAQASRPRRSLEDEGRAGYRSHEQENTMASDSGKISFVDKLAGAGTAQEARPTAGQSPCEETALSHVRRIAIYVDEPRPGHFFWVLAEECDDASYWRELESAELSYEMWLDALHAGVRALEGYALDDRIGPRGPGPAKTPA